MNIKRETLASYIKLMENTKNYQLCSFWSKENSLGELQKKL